MIEGGEGLERGTLQKRDAAEPPRAQSDVASSISPRVAMPSTGSRDGLSIPRTREREVHELEGSDLVGGHVQRVELIDSLSIER